MSLMVTFFIHAKHFYTGKSEWHSNVQSIGGSFLIWRAALQLHLAEFGHLWQILLQLLYKNRTLVNMCKTSSTPIINKGPGPIDNTIVNDQSTSLINFHEKYPIATMLLFGLLVLIVYFVHRKYCTKKAAASSCCRNWPSWRPPSMTRGGMPDLSCPEIAGAITKGNPYWLTPCSNY